jgi:hypothetical protein
MQRAEGCCEECGMTEEVSVKTWGSRLEVHHKDGNGARSSHPNHSLDNLQLLCKLCHRAIQVDVRKKVAS